MDQAIQKLVETFNGALAKTGGEAVRVWPDMVARRKTGAAVTMIVCGALDAVLAPLAVYALVAARTWTRTSSYDDGYIGWYILAVVCFIASVIAFAIGAESYPDLRYPEAAVVTDLVQSATSD